VQDHRRSVKAVASLKRCHFGEDRTRAPSTIFSAFIDGPRLHWFSDAVAHEHYTIEKVEYPS